MIRRPDGLGAFEFAVLASLRAMQSWMRLANRSVSAITGGLATESLSTEG